MSTAATGRRMKRSRRFDEESGFQSSQSGPEQNLGDATTGDPVVTRNGNEANVKNSHGTSNNNTSDVCQSPEGPGETTETGSTGSMEYPTKSGKVIDFVVDSFGSLTVMILIWTVFLCAAGSYGSL